MVPRASRAGRKPLGTALSTGRRVDAALPRCLASENKAIILGMVERDLDLITRIVSNTRRVSVIPHVTVPIGAADAHGRAS